MNAYEIARAEATRVVEAAYRKAVAAGELPEGTIPPVAVETPKDSSNGDWASTFAMQCAKPLHMAPRKMCIRDSLDREDVELPEDLVFIQDILGFKVFDLRVDRVIGRIRDVLTSNPAHDMYEIAGEDGRLIYIPAIKPFLKEIDMEAGVIYVESIEGLIE